MEQLNYENLYKSKNFYPIGPLNIIRNNHILKIIRQSPPKKILDIGCGRGFLDIQLAKKGHTVFGVDFSENAISFAKKLAKEEGVDEITQFIVNDIFKLNLSEKFDIVICSEVLEHIKDDKKAITKLKTFMKIEGRLIITVPYNIRQWNKVDILSGHFRRYSLNDIKKILEDDKLHIEDLLVWGFPLMRLYEFLYRLTIKYKKDDALPLGYIPKGWLLRAYKYLSQPIIKIFYIDDLFNFTKKGIDLVVVCRQVGK